MSKLKVIGALATASVGFAIFWSPAHAHGFGERYDLPIPLNYFLLGAAATVAVSFVVIGLFMRQSGKGFEYIRVNFWSNVAFRVLARILSRLTGFLSVLLLALTVIAGLYGTGDALDNFTPTFVWIIWWVGVGYVVALIGNVWAIANPWQVAFEWYEKVFCKDGFLRHPPLSWPSNFDSWPALAGFLLFAWIENVYPGSSRPFTLSVLILIYSAYTWCGMFLFGKYTWLRRGDPFAVLFALFARFSPTEIRILKQSGHVDICSLCISGCLGNRDLVDCVDCYECWELSGDFDSSLELRQLSIRPWAVGLSRGERVSTALVAFHITALATVTFDGLSETPAWVAAQNAMWPLIDPLPGAAAATIESLGTLFIPVGFAGVYIFVCGLVSRMSGHSMKKPEVVRKFVFSLVPIALAYNLSHYISFLLITGQQIVPLISNPFGCGLSDWTGFVCMRGVFPGFEWNLFGTMGYKPNIGLIDARFAWIVSVTALVLGHIISVFTAHVISLRSVRNHSIAVRSQYPMLFLMIFYTAVSLWIIAQPLIS
tara:strand:- start:375 stop:1997 length:1623 start_codon:yes stop_codon:yes gene_type:complete